MAGCSMKPMKTHRNRTACKVVLAVVLCMAVVLLLSAMLARVCVKRLASPWPARVEGVRLTPSRPVLSTADLSPTNAFFHLIAMTNPLPSTYRRMLDEEVWIWTASGAQGAPYPAFETWPVSNVVNLGHWTTAASLDFSHVPSVLSITGAIPNISGFVQMAKYQSIYASMLATRGRWSEACRSWQENLRNASHIMRGGGLMSHLAGLAALQCTLKSVRDAALLDTLPPEAAEQLAAALERSESHLEPLAEVFRVELQVQWSTLRAVYADPHAFGGPATQSVSRTAFRVHRMLGSTEARSRRHFEAFFSQIIAACEPRPDWTRIQRLEAAFEHPRRYLLDDPIGGIVAVLTVPSTLRVIRRQIACEAALRGTATVVALRRYQVDHRGTVPSRLADLVPAYLPGIPADPFTDDARPLQYIPGSEDWVIYSVGPNRRDEGGTIDSELSGEKPGQCGDMLFGLRFKRIDVAHAEHILEVYRRESSAAIAAPSAP